MKVVLNATTLVKGGALQACVSFILESAASDDTVSWVYILSRQVDEQLSKFDIDRAGKDIRVLDTSPAQNLKTRNELVAMVGDISPDAVFTFFGPAYVKFEVPHLMGVADGWVTHSTMLAYRSLSSLRDRFVTLMRCVYKGWWYRYADHWVVEADSAANGLSSRMFVPAERVSVVSNSCAEQYKRDTDQRMELATEKRLRFLTLSSYYPHKNLEIIPDVAAKLKRIRSDDDFVFILTVKPCIEVDAILERAASLGVSDNVLNIGPVDIKDGPSLYRSVDIAFVPTLLETFTAAYPEAMSMGKPIVTTDLGFAHDICDEAAVYFSPRDHAAAARSISRVIDDAGLADRLVRSGQLRLSSFPDAYGKYEAYVGILERLVAGETV